VSGLAIQHLSGQGVANRGLLLDFASEASGTRTLNYSPSHTPIGEQLTDCSLPLSHLCWTITATLFHRVHFRREGERVSARCRRGGAPPRRDRSGKPELTKAPRSYDRGRGNSGRIPRGQARKGRPGRRGGRSAPPSRTNNGAGIVSRRKLGGIAGIYGRLRLDILRIRSLSGWVEQDERLNKCWTFK